MELDTNTNEYYIIMDDVTNNTMFSSNDMGSRGIDDKALKILSHSIYRLIYRHYKGAFIEDHRTFMQTILSNNANNERYYLMNAMLEMVKGAVQSGMDLNAYLNEPSDIYPPTVYEELRNGHLLDASRKIIL